MVSHYLIYKKVKYIDDGRDLRLENGYRKEVQESVYVVEVCEDVV